MTFTTEKHELTRYNESTYKQIFKQCFPDKWSDSIPFKTDPIIAAHAPDGRVVGFCFVHSEPPYTMTYGAAPFMYNLCVSPDSRNLGAGTAILDRVRALYPQVYSHMLVSDAYHGMLTKRGWKRIGVWREKFVEYSAGFEVTEEVDVPKDVCTDHYDPDENVVYID